MLVVHDGGCVWLSRVAAELLSLLLVSVLWGCTNPLLKRGAEGIEHVTKTNRAAQLLAEVKFLFLNLKVNVDTSYSCFFKKNAFYAYYHCPLQLGLIANSSLCCCSVPGPVSPEPVWLFGLLLHTVHHRWGTRTSQAAASTEQKELSCYTIH